jgi:predicted lipid-binding transport protein (Tim44 family)
LQLIYTELNPAWTALDLTPVRGFVSDGLFDYLQYWIDAYRHQGLRNQLTGMHLTRWELAKVVRDKHFDAMTIRIWASGRDYTVVQASGQVVGGNPNVDRDYSEYWTLIRGAGVKGAPRADKNCPNCGAPLEVSMAGRCNHCDAKITSGEFDWVLSKIEQDESYSG